MAFGIWSKLPLVDPVTIPTNKGFPAIRATVRSDDQDLVLWSVHTRAPPIEGGPLDVWTGDLEALRSLLHAETGNVIVAGDFNATSHHRPYRKIVENGYRDEHIETGRGLARTWPMDRPRLARWGGIIRIDHVMTHGAVHATRLEEEPGLGSDHRGLIADFVLR